MNSIDFEDVFYGLLKTGKFGRKIKIEGYDFVCPFFNGLAIAIKDRSIDDILSGKKGFVNEEGIEVIPCIYDKAEPFDTNIEGLAYVKLNNKAGYIDRAGKEVIPIVYDSIRDFKEFKDYESKKSIWAAIFCKSGKYGMMTREGKEIIPAEYDDLEVRYSSSNKRNLEVDSKYSNGVNPLNYIFRVKEM